MFWMKHLSTRRKSRAATRTKKRQRLFRALQLESLEMRRVFAATWSLSGGTLSIHADENGTSAVVFDPIPGHPYNAVIVSAQSGDGNWSFGVPEPAIQSIRFYGSDSDDTFVNSTGISSRMYGYGGNDELRGGWGTDRIWGQNGDDVLEGNGGQDYLYGGQGDDTAFGGNGNDYLYGQHDNDHLFGGQGNDYLSGGSGRDGIYGDQGVDTAHGGSGPDRFLYHTTDVMNLVQDNSSEDVITHFGNAPEVVKNFNGSTTTFEAGSWVEEDVLQVDISLDLMAQRTGNNVLLRDVNGNELFFYRHGQANTVGGGNYTAYNSGGDMYFSDAVFASEDNVVRTVTHEVAHNWDTASEVDQRLPGQGEAIINAPGGFRSASVWVASPALGITQPTFLVSGDGKWSYFIAAQFARNYGRTNPYEDFSTSFAAYFMDYDGRFYPGLGAAGIPTKMAVIDNLLDQLSNVTSLAFAGVAIRPSSDSLELRASSEPSLSANAIVPPISIQAGVVTVHGSDANDNVTVHYVDAPGGTVSSWPADWVRVQRTNNTGTVMQHFQTTVVTELAVHLYGGDDVLLNQTQIVSMAYGGAGNDLLIGGSATDEFRGGAGHDRLLGRDGNDVLDGEEGNDRLYGGQGFDFLVGAQGNDRLYGGAHDDSLFGGLNDDLLVGGAGNDILDGGDSDDILRGGSGRDILIGGLGRDQLNGGPGQDLLIGGAIAFEDPHVALNHIWAEWTSDHSLGHRRRNVLDYQHPESAQRLNGNYVLTAQTVIDDGALDEFITQFADDEDLLLVGDYDDYLPSGPGDAAVHF